MKTQDLIKFKQIKTNLPVAEVFKNRFSPRFFSEEPISDKEIQTIMEAVRWSPSSYNLQPWYFYLAKKGSEMFEKLSETLMSGNAWAKQAPLLILACYIEESPFGKNAYAQYDLGQAVATLVYQAQMLGIYSRQMAGFDKQKAKKLLKDPTHQPFVLIALGRIGDYEKAPKEILEKDSTPRSRKEKIYAVFE